MGSAYLLRVHVIILSLQASSFKSLKYFKNHPVVLRLLFMFLVLKLLILGTRSGDLPHVKNFHIIRKLVTAAPAGKHLTNIQF